MKVILMHFCPFLHNVCHVGDITKNVKMESLISKDLEAMVFEYGHATMFMYRLTYHYYGRLCIMQ